jgi:dTDP-glucose pyrophosphorylase
MKALILAAGRGARLGTATQDINKCMLHVAGKPLIDYSFACAAALEEISEIIVVVGYRKSDVTERFGSAYAGKQVTYVTQDQQHGLVHAIACAAGALGTDDFMLMLGDELMLNPRHRAFVGEFSKGASFALCGVVEVKDRNLISKTYSVIQLADGRISRLIEKPQSPQNSMMGTGNCIFNNDILKYIPATPINQKRGEKELPDLIQCAIDDGHGVRPFVICDEYVNINDQQELNRVTSAFTHI